MGKGVAEGVNLQAEITWWQVCPLGGASEAPGSLGIVPCLRTGNLLAFRVTSPGCAASWGLPLGLRDDLSLQIDYIWFAQKAFMAL